MTCHCGILSFLPAKATLIASYKWQAAPWMFFTLILANASEFRQFVHFATVLHSPHIEQRLFVSENDFEVQLGRLLSQRLCFNICTWQTTDIESVCDDQKRHFWWDTGTICSLICDNRTRQAKIWYFPNTNQVFFVSNSNQIITQCCHNIKLNIEHEETSSVNMLKKVLRHQGHGNFKY